MKQPEDYSPFDILSIHQIERKKDNEFANQIADSQLADYANSTIREKIKKARKQGHKNWWKNEETPIAKLKEQLKEHVEKGDWVDVAIFAIMIQARECAWWDANNKKIPD